MNDENNILGKIYELSLDENNNFNFIKIPITLLEDKLFNYNKTKIDSILKYFLEKQIIEADKADQGPIHFSGIKLTAVGLDYYSKTLNDSNIINKYNNPLPKKAKEIDITLEKLYEKLITLQEGSKEYIICKDRIEQIRDLKNSKLKIREIILIIVSIITTLWAITDLLLRFIFNI